MYKFFPNQGRLLRAVSTPLQLWGTAVAFAVPALWLVFHSDYSVLAFLVVAAAFWISWILNRQTSLLIIFASLFLLGDIRRIVNTFAGYPKLDPQLIAAPIFVVCLTLPILFRVKVTDMISKAVLALTAIMAAEIVNPRQGSILVGLSGALFFLTPLCWFWIARTYGTERMVFLLLYRVVVPLGVLAGILGIYQTYVGFLPWEQAWIKHALENGYVALNLGNGHIRPFGYSVNGVEYATLLMLSNVLLVAAVFAGRRAYALLFVVLLPAQLLASERGAILKLLVSGVVIWAIRGRNKATWLPRVIFGAVVGLALLIVAAKQGSSSAGGSSSAQTATSHVTEGLAHPLDARYSTAGLHAAYFFSGVYNGFKYPLGSGLGVVTMGAGKFGGGADVGGSSEIDVSDAFITTGFIGGFVYLFTIISGLAAVGKYVLGGPRLLSYALLGVLTSMLLAWMPLGQYAVGPMLWFCIGFIARQRLAAVSLDQEETSAAEEAALVTAS